MVQMDRQLANEKNPVRVLPVDPGNVATGIFDAGFGEVKVYRAVMKFFYWLSFYVVSVVSCLECTTADLSRLVCLDHPCIRCTQPRARWQCSTLLSSRMHTSSL